MELKYSCQEKSAVRLLVVEDELDLLRALEKAFREEGYAVDTASDGEDGLFKATSWDYDAIVLDLMLPKLDGGELLKRLRRHQDDSRVDSDGPRCLAGSGQRT